MLNNPFNKPNPFKAGYYESVKPYHVPSMSTKDFSHIAHNNSVRHQYSQVSNNWSFNQNNLTRKVDFSRKNELKSSQVTQFQLRMRTSTVFTLPNNQSRVAQFHEGKIENPFHRKNLLVNKQAVNSQIQADLSIYRNRTTNSAYQSSAGRPSYGYGMSKVEESPMVREKISNYIYEQDYRQVRQIVIPQVYVEPYNPYLYPKASQRTERDSNPQKQVLAPKTLQYRKKTFYLNTPVTK